MHLDDLTASKVAALVTRREVRDYIDVSAFLVDHTAQQLLEMARTVDPDLEPDDVATVAEHLNRIPDRAFARYTIAASEVAELRRRFLAWPGSP